MLITCRFLVIFLVVSRKKRNFGGRIKRLILKIMALEIRSIPVLTGETAERFVREAEENERNPQRKALRMSFADVEKILVRSTANLKAHGGKSPFAK